MYATTWTLRKPDLRLKKAVAGSAARAFDPKVGMEAEAASARQLADLGVKLVDLAIENDFVAKRFGR
jgi:transposase